MIEIGEPNWREALQDELLKPYFQQLSDFVDRAYAEGEVFPPREKIFAAFEHTPFDQVRAVILGQDPYHEPGEAQGLAFYVPPSVKTPPSLRNLAKEIRREYPGKFAEDALPNLLDWTHQGVLLINATLTVAAHRAGSHQRQGWETFTDAVISTLSENRDHLVFLLWGNHARSKAPLIDRARHLILEAAHPSPLSANRGFFGCDHFRKANEFLARHGMTAIDW